MRGIPAAHAFALSRLVTMATPDTRRALRDQLAAAVPQTKELVNVPEGADAEHQIPVEVRSIPAGVRWRLEQEGFETKTERMLTAKFVPILLAAACYDPASGKRLWDDNETQLIEQLDQTVTKPLIAAAMRLAGWTKDATGKNSSEVAPVAGIGASSTSPENTESAPATS